MMMRASKIAIAGALALLGACAQTEAPAPNKNTNWLQACATDDDCGDALSCMCGVCTERCTSDDACAEGEGMATCRHEQSAELIAQCGEAPRRSSICVAACEDDADCERAGDDAHCEHGACIASTNTFEEPVLVGEPGDAGSDDAPCVPYGDGCAALIATGLTFPSSLEVRDERVYWLNHGFYSSLPESESETMLGSLESARVSGADRVVLARNLQSPTALALDADHAYFLIQDHEVEPFHTKLVRVPLSGGELEVVFDHDEYDFMAIVVDEANVYCAGFNNVQEPSADASVWNLYRIPKNGQPPQTAPELVFAALVGFPLEIVKRDSALYWKNGAEIRALDLTQPGSNSVMVPGKAGAGSQSLYIALTDTDVVWFQSSNQVEISRVDVTDPTNVTTSVTTGRFEPSDDFVADEDHVWWARRGEGLDQSVVRTDKATGQTVVIAESALLYRNDFALSEDYVLVTSSNPAGRVPAEGFIARFPRR